MIAPLLIGLTVGIAEYGMQSYAKLSVDGAARAGMQSLAINPGNVTGAQSAALAATTLDPVTMTVNVTQQCKCSDGTSVSCSGTCAGGSDVEIWYSVDTSTIYTRVFKLPGMADTVTLSGQTQIRVR